jgi:DNA polymerase-1
MKRVLLIDGDVLVYKTAFAAEQNIDWGEGLHTLHSDEESAKATVDNAITSLLERLEADDYVVALTCHETPNFRLSIYPQYKMNRADNRKPLVWGALREHLKWKWDAKLKPNLEADDILGILATNHSFEKKYIGHEIERIICSIDKDFKSIPCLFYNMKKREGIEKFNEHDANYFHMVQTLIGDKTDNYPGCAGIGPKKAEAILNPAETGGDYVAMWPRVLHAFKKAGFGPEYALVQARLARILRASDYNFRTKEPILWEPPQLQSSV